MLVTSTEDIAAATAAAECVVRVHERLVGFLRAGQTLPEIDGFVARALDDLNCRSAFLNYRVHGHPPFPSHACLSINECIVHGMHTMKHAPLKPGDILKVDIGVRHCGWIGDAAWTYAIEHAEPDALALMRCGVESLRRGVAALQPERPLMDFAEAVQGYVEYECGFHLARGLGGHGYGKKLHGPPFISNIVLGKREWPDGPLPVRPGMLMAVEPMLAIGTPHIRSEGRDWPIYTADDSLSVHYEADVLIMDHGPRNLTEGLYALPETVG